MFSSSNHQLLSPLGSMITEKSRESQEASLLFQWHLAFKSAAEEGKKRGSNTTMGSAGDKPIMCLGEVPQLGSRGHSRAAKSPESKKVLFLN